MCVLTVSLVRTQGSSAGWTAVVSPAVLSLFLGWQDRHFRTSVLVPSKIAQSEWLLSRLTKGKRDLLSRFVNMGGRCVKEAKEEMAGSGSPKQSALDGKWRGFDVVSIAFPAAKTNNAVDPQRLSAWDQTPPPSLLLGIAHRKQCVSVRVCNYTLFHRFPPWRTAWPDFLNGWNLESAALVPQTFLRCDAGGPS